MFLLLQIEFTPAQAGALFGAILGGLLGLIPLILGILKKRGKIGVLGFIAAIIGNAAFGVLLSIPIIVFSVYLILKKNNAPEFPAASENPTDSSENR